MIIQAWGVFVPRRLMAYTCHKKQTQGVQCIILYLLRCKPPSPLCVHYYFHYIYTCEQLTHTVNSDHKMKQWHKMGLQPPP